MQCRLGGGVLELVQGDITLQQVDAIVNAANRRLAGGGGGGRRHSPARRARHHGGDPAPLSRGLPHGSSRHHRSGRPPEPIRHPRRGDRSGRAAPVRSPRCWPPPTANALSWRWPTNAEASPSLPSPREPTATRCPGPPGLPFFTVIEFLQGRGAPELVRFVLFDEATFRAYADALSEKRPGQRI